MEMIRGESVLVYNRLNSMMCVLKAIPSGGGREWHYVERGFDRCVNTGVNSMKTMAGMLSTMKVNREVMARLAAEGFGAVTELADEIVRRTDLSFRHAHHIVGMTCVDAVKEGKKSNEITCEMLDEAAQKVIGKPLGLDESVIAKALDPFENVRIRETIGGPAPKEVKRMIKEREELLLQNKAALNERKKDLQIAAKLLLEACNNII
jgi:argininosuccinate lyase